MAGSFNPRIFHPEWFSRAEVIRPEERDAATVEIIHAEIASIRFEGIVINVDQNRFAADSTQEPFIRVLEFIVKTFKLNLSHTPISKVGINRNVHFRVSGIDALDRVGHALAPRQPWGAWGARTAAGTGPKHGGMRSITLEERDLPDRASGHVQATVQPSVKVVPGIYVAVNDHYELKEQDPQVGCAEIIDLVENAFEPSIKRSDTIIDQIMSLV